VSELDYKILRPWAETWIVTGRLGTPTLPHVFVAVRTGWQLDNKRMALSEIRIGTVELVPGGNIKSFGEHLAQMHKTMLEKRGVSHYTYADITRSIEAEPRVHELVPQATMVRILNPASKGWSLPFMEVGRPLIFSKMQVYLSDHKIHSGMRKTDDDPLKWSWASVRTALSTVGQKPPSSQGEEGTEHGTEDDVILALGLAIYCADMDEPSIYEKKVQGGVT
jgi:hypothetical protein